MGLYFSTVWGLNLLQNKHTHTKEKKREKAKLEKQSENNFICFLKRSGSIFTIRSFMNYLNVIHQNGKKE